MTANRMCKLLMVLMAATVVLQAAQLRAQQRIGDDRREAARHGWMSDYRQATKRARETGRPLMVVLRCVP